MTDITLNKQVVVLVIFISYPNCYNIADIIYFQMLFKLEGCYDFIYEV